MRLEDPQPADREFQGGTDLATSPVLRPFPRSIPRLVTKAEWQLTFDGMGLHDLFFLS